MVTALFIFSQPDSESFPHRTAEWQESKGPASMTSHFVLLPRACSVCCTAPRASGCFAILSWFICSGHRYYVPAFLRFTFFLGDHTDHHYSWSLEFLKQAGSWMMWVNHDASGYIMHNRASFKKFWFMLVLDVFGNFWVEKFCHLKLISMDFGGKNTVCVIGIEAGKLVRRVI